MGAITSRKQWPPPPGIRYVGEMYTVHVRDKDGNIIRSEQVQSSVRVWPSSLSSGGPGLSVDDDRSDEQHNGSMSNAIRHLEDG